jgi:hypothetical protein
MDVVAVLCSSLAVAVNASRVEMANVCASTVVGPSSTGLGIVFPDPELFFFGRAVGCPSGGPGAKRCPCYRQVLGLGFPHLGSL